MLKKKGGAGGTGAAGTSAGAMSAASAVAAVSSAGIPNSPAGGGDSAAATAATHDSLAFLMGSEFCTSPSPAVREKMSSSASQLPKSNVFAKVGCALTARRAPSMPASRPAQRLVLPQANLASSLQQTRMHYAIPLRQTSPILRGLTPGCLSRATRWQAISAW